MNTQANPRPAPEYGGLIRRLIESPELKIARLRSTAELLRYLAALKTLPPAPSQ